MAAEKKAMSVVFKMDKKMSIDKWRKRFIESYQGILDNPSINFKCWWCNEKKGEWGAFVIFDSNKDLKAYIKSDMWVKEVPAKYGSTGEINIFDQGPIMCRKTVTNGENSWITE